MKRCLIVAAVAAAFLAPHAPVWAGGGHHHHHGGHHGHFGHFGHHGGHFGHSDHHGGHFGWYGHHHHSGFHLGLGLGRHHHYYDDYPYGFGYVSPYAYGSYYPYSGYAYRSWSYPRYGTFGYARGCGSTVINVAPRRRAGSTIPGGSDLDEPPYHPRQREMDAPPALDDPPPPPADPSTDSSPGQPPAATWVVQRKSTGATKRVGLSYWRGGQHVAEEFGRQATTSSEVGPALDPPPVRPLVADQSLPWIAD